MAQIGLIEGESSRWYWFPGDAERDPYESVSTILSATDPAPWLVAWGAKLAAQAALEHAPTVELVREELGVPAAVKLLTGEAARRRELASEIGRHQHHILEALLTEAPIPDVPEHLAGARIDGEEVDQDAIADGFLNWLIDFGVDEGRMVIELSEATISNEEHQYAGTLDAVVRFDPPLVVRDVDPETGKVYERPPIRRLLVDCFTGRTVKRRKHAQMAAYRRCDLIWIDWIGNVATLPWADASAVLHIRRDYSRGYSLKLMPQDDEPAFARFLRLRDELHDVERDAKVEFRPIYAPGPDGKQPPPRLEDLPPGMRGALRKLQAAGFTDLAAVPRNRRDLLEVKGIGPALTALVAGLLDAYGIDHDLIDTPVEAVAGGG